MTFKINDFQKLIFSALVVMSLSACVPTYSNVGQACDKESAIMESIAQSEYEVLPDWSTASSAPLFVRVALDFVSGGLAKLTQQFLTVTVGFQYDLFPEGRTRVIHNFGSVAAIKFEAAEGQPFAGFYNGAPCGVVRLSVAGAPTEEGILPGMALKFLVDNHPSVNFVAMFSLDGQEGHNFFKNEFSNFLELPESGLLLQLSNIFKEVTDDPFKVDVTHLANFDETGAVAVPAIYPYIHSTPEQLYLVPNTTDLSFSETAHEVRDDFATIPVDTTLYSVWGRRKGETEKIYIGDIVTKTKFISSSYGDHNLFFRHETVDGK